MSRKVLEGEWREWLDLAASLWDAFSLIGAFITALVVFLFFRDRPTEMVAVIAAAVMAIGALAGVALVFIWVKWVRKEPERITGIVYHLKELSSPIILKILIASNHGSMTQQELLAAMRASGLTDADHKLEQDLKELESCGFVESDGRAISLTKRARKHRALISSAIEEAVDTGEE